MFKLNLFTKTSDAAGSKKKQKEILFLILLLWAMFSRFLLMPDLKKVKGLNAERVIKRDELNRRKTELYSTQELLKNPQKYEEAYQQAAKALASLEDTIKHLKEALVKKESLAEVLNYLTKGANPGEVEFNLISMSALTNRQYFNELPIKMKLTCNFPAFLDYIDSLESLPILVNFKELKLSSPDSTGLINVEAEIAVYVSLQ